METALGWIGDIFRFLLSLVPRLIIVRATHAGVKFVCGRRPCSMPPGLHFVWPITTEYELVPVVFQTTNLPPQYLVTADGKTVGISGIVAYEIVDAYKLLTGCWDYEDPIRDMSLAAIKDVITVNDFETLKSQAVEIDEQLTGRIDESLAPFGVKVSRVQLTDFSSCIVVATWGAGSSIVTTGRA